VTAGVRIALVGPAGCGKTTIGSRLAARLAVPFVDADDLHTADARLRMARGEPLDDAARAPWLAAVNARVRVLAGFVLACSALRAAYRERLADGVAGLHWVSLQVPPAELARRLGQRVHFFPPALLASQLATWEPLVAGVQVDATAEPDAVVAAIVRSLPPTG
jgi:gluconokinase